jgi:hypothetical protein
LSLKFSNLFPEDLPRQVQRSALRVDQGKWLEITSKGQIRSALGIYLFVTMQSRVFVRRASTRIQGDPIGHVDLALGKDVDYAGQIHFSHRKRRGILLYWTNASGHYKLDAQSMGNANLPPELFQAIELATQIS